MKKLLTMIGAITLGATTTTNVAGCECSPTKNNEDKKIDLNTIITDKNLDSIYIGQAEKVTKSQILEKIKAKNTSVAKLTENDFEFIGESATGKNSTIIGKNNYKNEVSLTFNNNNFKAIDINGIANNAIIQNIKKNNNLTYISTTDGHIYKSIDNKKFTPITVIKGTINSLNSDKDGNIYVTSSGDDNVYKINNMDVLTKMTGTTGTIKALTVDKRGNIYAGSSNGNFYQSTDKETFTIKKNIGYAIWNLTIAPNGTIYVATPSGIFKSINNGKEFDSIYSTPTTKSLTVDNNNNIYFGNNNGSIYKSTDGTTFTQMKIVVSGVVTNLTTDKDGNIYAVNKNSRGNDSVYKSINNNTFTAMTGTTGTINSLIIDNNNNIYVAGAVKNKATIYLSEKLSH
ncbi:lipoprotein [Spiroplasma endosymbiont of Polydrusus pterygomalis]|uniref:lipoprotein n=1 Tax=Spiroplasma endosymbiont of Polydrusus pterygomalis TaxID=3139327 RepID=UPI003CCAD754